jgi:hypothetical protein
LDASQQPARWPIPSTRLWRAGTPCEAPIAQPRRHTGQGYDGERHRAPMPAERAARLPWLLIPDAGGALLNTPWRRGAALNTAEAAAVEVMRGNMAGARSPAAPCWINPADGAETPVTASPAWLAARMRDYVTVRV